MSALAQDLGEVILLDTRHLGDEGTVGAYLLPGPEGAFALIECGPAVTLPNLEAAIHEAGYALDGLRAVLLTHIHFDHAGASGSLAIRYGADVYVHEVGAPHLKDPTKLVASATRIYGDAMDSLWGTLLAVPEAQLHPLKDGDTLTVLGHKIQVLYTPGHASHHVSYQLGASLFSGDSAGIKLAGSSVIRPATPPPETDLELWEASIDKMLALKPERLLLTHFGEVKDAERHLRLVKERNRSWAEVILAGLRAGEDDDALVRRITELGERELREDGASPEVMAKHAVSSNYEMTVTGLKRYWQKLRPEGLKV